MRSIAARLGISRNTVARAVSAEGPPAYVRAPQDSGIKGVEISAICPDGAWTPMLADKLDDPDAAGSFSGQLLTAERIAREVDELIQRPRPLVIVPRWRGVQLRLLDLFPRLTLRLLPLALADARRKQRRYRKLIEAGKWPK